MSDIQKLVQYKNDILRAEIVGWLHNIGKMEPNINHIYQILKQMSGWSDAFKIGKGDAYSFCRFTEPGVLISEFPYKNKKGVMYFIDIDKRGELEKFDNRIEKLKEQLAQNPPNRAELGCQLQDVTNEKKHFQEKLEEEEQCLWKEYEKNIDCLSFDLPGLGLSLGALLTLFWERQWFERPNERNNNYKPGSDDDTDYQRQPKRSISLQSGFSMDYPSLLLLSHGEISGQEKMGMDLGDSYVSIKKSGNGTLSVSTAFGFESEVYPDWKNWPKQRKKIVDLAIEFWDDPQKGRNNLLGVLHKYFREALGDTQRPINEITLWDYAQAISALFKTSIAQVVLTGEVPTVENMRWRLASIRLNAFDFLFQVSQLSDLLARQKLLQNVWDAVQNALEVETPIGSAVYRDEHGLVFVLPEGKNSVEINTIIKTMINEVLNTKNNALIGAADLQPHIKMRPSQRGKKLLLTEVLSAGEPINIPDPALIKKYWSNYQNQERCSVCGLRPVGYIDKGLPHFVTKEKAKERNLCGICLARRGRRSEEWATERKFKETVWIDEVADINGRLALIVGRFDLDDWLNGVLVRSLAIGKDENGNWFPKAPTFARMQRVWRTTAEFWQEAKDHILKDLEDERRRIKMYFSQSPNLGAYHAYELEFGQTGISVIWCPLPNEDQGFLVSAANFDYVAKQLDAKQSIYKDSAAAAIYVEDFIKKSFIQNKCELVLKNPESVGSKRRQNLLAGNQIVRTEHQKVSYSTAIPILTDAHTFMALVPADKALKLIQDIKVKYESEMGKVRNRLPFHMGAVFAHRRMPLRAILDAGQQMLKQRPPESCEAWTVKTVYRGELPAEKTTVPNENKQFNHCVALELEQGSRSFTWYVPLKMGDGQTKDDWYPYVFMKNDADDDRSRKFQGLHPNGKHCWLVHVDELREGDQIYFIPATFDFEWLDTNARRFEIAYDKDRRRYSRPTRPYLLDDLDRWEALWNHMKVLAVSQCNQVIRTIEATRERWYGQEADGRSRSDPVFRQFVADTLAGAAWPKGHHWSRIQPKWRDKLIQAGVSGELADLAELYMDILKEKEQGGL